MSKKAVGYIKYLTTGKTIEYIDAKEMLADFKNELNNAGVNSAVAGTYNKNLDLRYELAKISYNEYGVDLPKKQYIIDATAPEFMMQEKLKAVYEHENRTGKKRRITEPYEDIYYTLKAGVLDNMSVKAIKNLVDRHYEAAMNTRNRAATPKIKRKK